MIIFINVVQFIKKNNCILTKLAYDYLIKKWHRIFEMNN